MQREEEQAKKPWTKIARISSRKKNPQTNNEMNIGLDGFICKKVMMWEREKREKW